MNDLMKLSRETQIVLVGIVLYVILSFLDWQQACAPGGSICVGQTEWHGIGVLGGLVAVALLLWEVGRVVGVKIALGALSPALISVVLAVALLVLTVITFLSHNEFRHWPEWTALIISILIAVAAVRRGRGEGVEMPKVGSAMGSGGGSGGGSTGGSSTGGSSTGAGGGSMGGGSMGGGSSTGMGGSGSSAAGGDEGGGKPPEA